MTRSTRAAGGTRDAPVPAKASSTAPSPSALTKQTNNSDGSRVGAVVKVESLAVLRRRQSEQSRLLASVLDGTKEVGDDVVPMTLANIRARWRGRTR